MLQEKRQINYKRYFNYTGAITLTLTSGYPFEFIRGRIQTSEELMENKTIKEPYLKVTSTALRVIKEEGISALWKGLGYYILRTVPSNLTVFAIKESIHSTLSNYILKNRMNNWLSRQLEMHYILVNSAVGGLAGLLVQATFYPFDYFRVVLANEIKNKPGAGIVRCIKDAYEHRGFRGIFNGVTISLSCVTAGRGLYFGIFDSFKNKTQNQFLRWGLSFSSMFVALITIYPFDTVRKRMIASPKKYQGIWDCMKRTWKYEGVNGYMKGWTSLSGITLTFCTLYYIYDLIFTQIFYSKTTV